MKVRDITHKVCKVCSEDLSVEHYGFDNANQRYESLCKKCKTEVNLQYRRENKERYNEYMRARYHRLKTEKNASTTND